MIRCTYCCQYSFRPLLLAILQTIGISLLSLTCVGCWQEVHYEPETNLVRAADAMEEPQGSTAASSSGATAASPLVVETSVPALPRNDSQSVDMPPAPTEQIAAVPSGIDKLQPVAPANPPMVPAAVVDDLQSTPVLVDHVAGKNGEKAVLDPFGDEVSSLAGPPASPSAEKSIALSPSTVSAVSSSNPLSSTALATWQMSSKWSMAIALQAKKQDAAVYRERLEQAKYGARLLGVALPSLPVHTVAADRLTVNLSYLLEEAGPRLAQSLRKQQGADHAALAELATKTHVLLLCYTPTSTRLKPVIHSIRQAAEKSGLPANLWQELVALLATKAEFKQVKAAIYRLHERVASHLSGQSPTAAAP